jgi:hypothetical protein
MAIKTLSHSSLHLVVRDIVKHHIPSLPSFGRQPQASDRDGDYKTILAAGKDLAQVGAQYPPYFAEDYPGGDDEADQHRARWGDLLNWRFIELAAAGEAESNGTLACREFVVHGNLRSAAASGCPRR